MKTITCFLILFSSILLAAASDKPNIVYILADDMGFDSVSANNPAIGKMRTPHIDKLISQGMNFTDAHSGSAVCTPTRYGLLTGRYCWRSRLKKAVLWDYGKPLIEKNRLSVASFLKGQGYNTAMIGKWHLGLNWPGKDGTFANAHLKDSDAFFKKGDAAKRVDKAEANIDYSGKITGGPLENGFDHWFGVDVPNFPPYGWIIDHKLQQIPSVVKPKEMFGHPGMMVPGWKLEEILPTLGQKSAEYIATAAKKEKPFFLYVPLTSPHTPIAPSATWKGKSGITHYADFVMETDAIVGQIVRAIDDAGIAKNTIVIFSTDNGTSAHRGQIKELKKKEVNLNKHFRGHKAQIYEGGHRVPFVVRWPGKISPGSSCDEITCLSDFFATAADILEQKLPDHVAEDSYSILPLLTGEAIALPNRPRVVNHDIGGRFAIRDGSWKLILIGKGQLYDLSKDPKETTNVAAEYPEQVKKMKATLDEYKKLGRSRSLGTKEPEQ